ncbi:Cytochrome P450 2D11 [Larimichthys crocea]|uniref:Uncharacterized protein n=1 Tax=Larimichthys crocea TaxID=215358 RepID=A0ACD3QDI0_LARCR|nr:Cytochrome P450 2D11 [Larimichthys crocea]
MHRADGLRHQQQTLEEEEEEEVVEEEEEDVSLPPQSRDLSDGPQRPGRQREQEAVSFGVFLGGTVLGDPAVSAAVRLTDCLLYESFTGHVVPSVGLFDTLLCLLGCFHWAKLLELELASHILKECFEVLFVLAVLLFLLLFPTHRSKNFPPGPRAFPILGNLLELNLESPIADFEKLAKRYGNVYSLFIGPRPVVILNGLQAMKEALVNKAADFSGRPQDLMVNRAVIVKAHAPGVVLADYNPAWKEQRRFGLMTLRNFGLGKHSMEQNILGQTRRIIKVLEQSVERCQQEIDKVMDGKDEANFEDRHQMPYVQVQGLLGRISEMLSRCYSAML